MKTLFRHAVVLSAIALVHGFNLFASAEEPPAPTVLDDGGKTEFPSPEEAEKLATDAYIFGLPLVMAYTASHEFWMDTKSSQYKGPLGQLSHTRRVFWSVTMYDGKSQLLIKNPINRYLINSPMLASMKKNADGSLTLHIQKDSPGADKESNWLPAPDGPVYLVMRIYWPQVEPPSILPAGDGSWQPPALVIAE